MEITSNAPTVKVCKVFDVDDKTGGDRIKVKLLPEDNRNSEKNIPWANPLLPKMYHIIPKVGEYVYVFTSDDKNGNSRRYYIGPIIPQQSDMYAAKNITALSMMNGAYTNPLPNPENEENAKGAYPDKDDVCVIGRKSCDLQIKDDDIRLKAGVKKVTTSDDSTYSEFNVDNTHAFIKLKYDSDGNIPRTSDEYNSTATIVADKINLIGNRSKKTDCVFDTSDTVDLITDEEMENIMARAHCLPYGDVLCDILRQFFNCFKRHTHPFPMLPPCPDAELRAVDNRMSTLEDDMLTNNVRIN